MLIQNFSKVFMIDNQNGVFCFGEKVLKDIRVPNGLNAVETGSEDGGQECRSKYPRNLKYEVYVFAYDPVTGN